MKNLLLALTLLTLSPRLARAQEAPNAPLAERVIYSRAVPKALAAWVPRGGKSRFWGATKLQWEGKPVWVHVYDVTNTLSKDQIYMSAKQNSGLDLFVFVWPRHLKKISSTHFTYTRLGGDETVGVKTLQLDPKTEKMPIFQVELRMPGEGNADEFQYALIVFDAGVDKRATVEQRFGLGENNASNWSSWKIDFFIMNNGLTGVVYWVYGRFEYTKTFYKWDKDHFEPFRRTLTSAFDEHITKEIPFDTPWVAT